MAIAHKKENIDCVNWITENYTKRELKIYSVVNIFIYSVCIWIVSDNKVRHYLWKFWSRLNVQ